MKTQIDMMIRLFLVILLIITTSTIINAQTGVAINSDNSDPDASAALDVKATDQGILIPRVALTGTTDATTITRPGNPI